MRAVKIYALVWVLAAFALAAAQFGGFSGEMTQMIFGLFFATLLGAGVVMVLPAWIHENFASKF